LTNALRATASAAAPPAGAVNCAQCDEAPAVWHCTECDTKTDLCDTCFPLLHKAAKKKGHVRQPI
jgi:hypothetical protein